MPIVFTRTIVIRVGLSDRSETGRTRLMYGMRLRDPMLG